MSIIKSISRAVYTSGDKSSIDCVIEFDTIGFPVPFTACATDIEQHGLDVYAALISGTYGKIADYVPIFSKLLDVQAAQTILISTACGAAITAGMPSSALGSIYIYPTTDSDQARMGAAVNLSNLPGNSANWSMPIKCQNAAGAWIRIAHTAPQLQRAAQDVAALIIALLLKYDVLAAQIAAATSVSAVKAITWS